MVENGMTTRQEWVEYLRSFAEKLTANDAVAMAAIEAIRSLAGSTSPPDEPSKSVSKVVAANQEAKSEVFRSLTEFVARELALANLLERIDAQPIDPVVKANMLKEIAEAVARGQEPASGDE